MERGTIMVRQGKGKKDRMVPTGDRAVAWIDKYVTEVRPGLVLEPDDGILFLTNTGDPFNPNRLTQMVRHHVDAADIGKRGACHLFRHTMATIMLENGVDIRFIQEMLGHAEPTTTQIYTQVSIKKLKEIHTATHPTRSLGGHAPRRGAKGRSSPAHQTPSPFLSCLAGSVPIGDGLEVCEVDGSSSRCCVSWRACSRRRRHRRTRPRGRKTASGVSRSRSRLTSGVRTL